MKLFVCGNSRSGTTMMSRILGNHPEIFSFQELHYFDELLPDPRQEITLEKATKLYATLCSIQRNGYFAKREPEQFRSEAEKALQLSEDLNGLSVYEKFLTEKTREQGKSIPCEQTPQNIFSSNILLKAFSKAFIIIMVRDPRAVLLSQKNKWMRRTLSGGKIPLREAIRTRINYHPVTISRLWKSVMQESLKLSDNKWVMLIRYEDLVENPESTIQQLCNKIGISFDNKMLQIPITGSSNTGDVPSNTGIDVSRTHQWETGALNDAEIGICQDLNRDIMEQFGYVPKNVNANTLMIIGYKLMLPFQLILIAMVNVKRWKYYWKRFF